MLFFNNKCAIKAPRKISDDTEQHSKQEKCYRLGDLGRANDYFEFWQFSQDNSAVGMFWFICGKFVVSLRLLKPV